jgi:hypothetical protein
MTCGSDEGAGFSARLPARIAAGRKPRSGARELVGPLRTVHHFRMYYVHAEVVRWVDDEWPGWVQVRLTESDGTVASLVDKVPIFDSDDRLEPGADLPIGIEIPCDLLDWTVDQGGKRTAHVRLHFHIEDQSGRRTFNVAEGALVQRS